MVAPSHVADLESGLTEAEAAACLQSDGPNELPTAKPRSLFATAWEILREPMILLLVGAGAIYLFLGELRDSVVLLVSIFVVIGISLYQERKTERALEALRDLSSAERKLQHPAVLAIRNAARQELFR